MPTFMHVTADSCVLVCIRQHTKKAEEEFKDVKAVVNDRRNS